MIMTINTAASAEMPKSPPGWGKDELTKFLDNARDNQHATYFRKREIVGKLIEIDAQLVTVSKNWLNPDSEILAQLLLRCHAAFRTAAGLAMAGQACEATAICRSMLEFAAYALHMHCNPELEEVWLNRHDDDASFKKQKKAFQQVNVLASVKAANRHAGGRFEDLYQRTIDFGGHPNERSVTGNLRMVKEPGKRNMMAILLHGDGPALDHALKTVAQCGMTSLEMLQIPFHARFELLGVNAAMLELRKGL
jgi:hypothetical protein